MKNTKYISIVYLFILVNVNFVKIKSHTSWTHNILFIHRFRTMKVFLKTMFPASFVTILFFFVSIALSYGLSGSQVSVSIDK